mgnify:CR=1 FL=1
MIPNFVKKWWILLFYSYSGSMDSNIVTLIVGLAGITATLIASGLGFSFTAKARSGALREALFDKQLEMITKIIHKQGRIRVFATILDGDDEASKEQARDDMGECIRQFSELQEEAAAILPTELWVEVKQLNNQMIQMLVDYDEDKGITEDHLTELAAREAKVGLLSRAVLGVDELTEQSMNLFTKKNSLERLADMEIEHFRKIHNRANS